MRSWVHLKGQEVSKYNPPSIATVLAMALLIGCAPDKVSALRADQVDVGDGPKAALLAMVSAPVSSALTDTDKIMLMQAKTACGGGKYSQFFDAFIQSAAVRRKYSAETINYVVRAADNEIVSRDEIPANVYLNFPLRMSDYYRKTVTPFRAGDEDEYVELVPNQSQSNRISFEWARVHYVGASGEGDDLGAPQDLNGDPYDRQGFKDGRFLFRPTDECWELVEETRYQRK
jgi:hypothetical protein